MFVSRVVQTGLPEFGTLLAHIWPKGAQADALEDLINLFGSIDLEWSHPPGSNRRPADYESAALPTELGWLLLSVKYGQTEPFSGVDKMDLFDRFLQERTYLKDVSPKRSATTAGCEEHTSPF